MKYSTTPYLRHYGIKGMKWRHHKKVINNRYSSADHTRFKNQKSELNYKRAEKKDKDSRMQNLGITYQTSKNSYTTIGFDKKVYAANIKKVRALIGKTLSNISSKTVAAGKKVVNALKIFGKTIASQASKAVNTGKNFVKNAFGTKYKTTIDTAVGMSKAKGKGRIAHITTTETGTIKNGKKTVTSRTTKTEQR